MPTRRHHSYLRVLEQYYVLMAGRKGFSSLLLVGAVLGVAALGRLVFDWHDVEPSFFSTCAQIAPVLAVAFFVEVAVVMTPLLSNTDDAAAKAMTKFLVRSNAAMLVVSEASSLYATATKTSSTFLVLGSVLPWLLQLLMIVDTSYYRIGVHRMQRPASRNAQS